MAGHSAVRAPYRARSRSSSSTPARVRRDDRRRRDPAFWGAAPARGRVEGPGSVVTDWLPIVLVIGVVFIGYIVERSRQRAAREKLFAEKLAALRVPCGRLIGDPGLTTRVVAVPVYGEEVFNSRLIQPYAEQQYALELVCGGRSDERAVYRCTADLVPAFDSYIGVDVSVQVDGRPIGFLPRRTADVWCWALDKRGVRGRAVSCTVDIYMGYDALLRDGTLRPQQFLAYVHLPPVRAYGSLAYSGDGLAGSIELTVNVGDRT
jgi:hypothetical protein